MRRALVIAAVIVAAAVVVLVFIQRRPAKPRYVFLVCLDAVRRDHLSCYGYGVKTTPRIDELAAQGVVFEDAITQAPWTTPSVATVLSSQFPCQHGVRRREASADPYTSMGVNCLEKLVALGFETALFTGGIALKEKVPTSELVQSALLWAKRNRDSRCLAVIHTYETHSPYVAIREYVDALDPGYSGPYAARFGDLDLLKQARLGRLGQTIKLTDADIKHARALYDGQIMRADLAVGTLVNFLETWGMLEQSMIIVFADHGEEFMEHGSVEHGQTVYEESIRVPLVVYCPALTKGPKRVAEQVGLIDLAPTIFDALGVKKPADFEGRSLAPLMSARFKPEPDSLRPCGLPKKCLITESVAHRSEKKALRCPPWKLIFDPFLGAVELYNLAADPGETVNLVDAEPEVTARLAKTLLVMEKYYPGGWCVAWRDPRGGAVAGTVEVDGNFVEAVAHEFFPEADAPRDSLAASQDGRQVRFAATAGPALRGVEIRMAQKASATFALEAAGSDGAIVGPAALRRAFPLAVAPDSARVERAALRSFLAGLGSPRAGDAPAGAAGAHPGVSPSWQCAIYWLEPGTEPVARAAKDRELKQQLKAIGYIE
jgi:arylsulfatase A-like enzyme